MSQLQFKMKFQMKKLYILLLIALTGVIGCKPELDQEFTPSAGPLNFSTYVALGNSLTAGYTDAALYRTGQENAYPVILAQQFKQVGGGEFKIPYMPDDLGIGIIETPPYFRTKLILGSTTDCLGNTSLGPKPAGSPSLSFLAPIASQGPFNNLGVPGTKSFHIRTPQYGDPDPTKGNPFYARMAIAPGTSTILSDALAVNPTFFTSWIGNMDVLAYALAGGESDNITSADFFANELDQILSQLSANNREGAIANIPNVTTIPYFTTIPYNGLVLSRQGQVDSLNAAYAPANIKFNLGPNPFIIKDSTDIRGRRPIKSNELLLLNLPQDSLKCKGWGTTRPIPEKYVLDEKEINEITTAINNFNQIISASAKKYNLALVNINIRQNELKSGIAFDGITFNTNFITGGVYSLDGIHLTPRGNAIVANYFIQAINDYYGSQIQTVDVTRYPGVLFP